MKCKQCGKTIAHNNKTGYCKSCLPDDLKTHCIKCGIIIKDSHKSGLCKKCSQLGISRNSPESIQKRKETCIKKYGVDNPFKSKEIQEKIKQTNLEKYGVEYSFQSENNKEKSKQTMKEKYGGHSSANIQVKEKLKKTNLERYGVEYTYQSENNKEKSRKTKLERYGSETFNNREKASQTCLERYGVNNAGKAGSFTLSNTLQEKDSEFYRLRAQRASRKISIIINGVYADSSWEENFIKSHSGCVRGPIIEFIDNDNKKRKWLVDFEWEGKLYEVKNPWLLNEENIWPGNSRLKFSLSKELGVRWYLWNPGTWRQPKLDKIEEFKIEENLAKYIVWPGMLEKFFNKKGDKMLYEKEIEKVSSGWTL
jgi:hypothetical protein